MPRFSVKPGLRVLARGDDPPEPPAHGGLRAPHNPRGRDDPPEPPAHGGLRAPHNPRGELGAGDQAAQGLRRLGVGLGVLH